MIAICLFCPRPYTDAIIAHADGEAIFEPRHTDNYGRGMSMFRNIDECFTDDIEEMGCITRGQRDRPGRAGESHEIASMLETGEERFHCCLQIEGLILLRLQTTQRLAYSEQTFLRKLVPGFQLREHCVLHRTIVVCEFAEAKIRHIRHQGSQR